MTITEKITRAKADYDEVYEAGYEKGKSEGGGNTDFTYYLTSLYYLYAKAVFPENTELNLRLAKLLEKDASYLFRYAKNIKKFTLTIENPAVSAIKGSIFRECADIEIVDFTNINVGFEDVSYFALGASKLKSIYGALDFSLCTSATIWLNGASALEDIEFVPNTIKISIDFYWCQKLTKSSIESIINGLSSDVNGKTVTLLNQAVKNAFTTDEWEELKSTKANWTISLA